MSNPWDGIDPDDANTIRRMFSDAVEDALGDVERKFKIPAEQADAIFFDWYRRG